MQQKQTKFCSYPVSKQEFQNICRNRRKWVGDQIVKICRLRGLSTKPSFKVRDLVDIAVYANVDCLLAAQIADSIRIWPDGIKRCRPSMLRALQESPGTLEIIEQLRVETLEDILGEKAYYRYRPQIDTLGGVEAVAALPWVSCNPSSPAKGLENCP